MLDSPGVAPEFREMFRSGLDQKRKQIAAMIDNLGDAQLAQMGFLEPGATPAQARALLAEQREEIIEDLISAEVDGNVAAKVDREQEWYQITKTFMPPEGLWSRHPGYEKFRRFREDPGRASLSKKAKKEVSLREI